jgi:3-hydroxyisobutyrate dehydrogenase-like beta-hydroxyacid dehydrogenase
VSDAPAVAMIGLGEAGTAIATDLVSAGATVRGWDPVAAVPDGVEAAKDPESAAAGTDLVLSANSAAAAMDAAQSVAPALRENQVFADLNTAAPDLKRRLAEAVGPTSALFADVALIGPVPGNGLGTPALVSGTGAAVFAAALGPLGMPVTVVGDHAGDAAARKLARSVFAKGLAAAIGESLEASRQLGFEDWLYADLQRTLEDADGALLQRLIEGSRVHAKRRVDEMSAAVEMLGEVGVEPRIASASEAWLRSLARESEAGARR